MSILAIDLTVRFQMPNSDTGYFQVSGKELPQQSSDLIAHEGDSVEVEVNVRPGIEVSLWVGYELIPRVFERHTSENVITKYQWDVGFYAGNVNVFIVTDGSRIPVATVSVQPRGSKLLNNQYQQMLEELLAKMNSFFYESPVHLKMDITYQGPRYYVILAEQICRFWPDLFRALKQITANPQKRVEKVQIWDKLTSSRSSSMLVYREYVTGRKALPDKMSAVWETERVWDERYQVTEHSFENVATLGFLFDIQSNIRQILSYFEERPFHLKTRLKNINREVSRILKTPPFCDMEISKTRPKPTMVFRKDPRYQIVYRSFQTFRKGVASNQGMDLDVPLVQTFVLYEYWCFFKVVEALEQFESAKADLDLRSHLDSGVRIFDPLASATARVGSYVVYYQKPYSYSGINKTGDLHSISHQMIPDIVVEGRGNRWLFDAKYRSSRVGLNEALGDMHKYRDSIRDKNGERAFKEVYILCPNIVEESMRRRYTSPDYISQHGLGILELRTDYGLETLKRVFNMKTIYGA